MHITDYANTCPLALNIFNDFFGPCVPTVSNFPILSKYDAVVA